MVRDTKGKLLFHKAERQRASKLLFSCRLESEVSEVKGATSVKQVHTTIIKHTNKYREETSQGLKRVGFPRHRKV